MASVHVLILAAGEGKRMRSALPKVLHPVAGRPILVHVVRAATAIRPRSIHVVVPSGAPAFAAALGSYDVQLVVQDPPCGTADAVSVGCAAIDATAGTVLVINGDCPGVEPRTLRHLVDDHGSAAATVLAVRPDEPAAYGRIVTDDAGELLRIVELADASDEERSIGLVNGGVYCFDLALLRQALDGIGADNVQGERYLTDVLERLRDAGPIRVFEHDDAEEVHGVNDRMELARAEQLLRRRKLAELMAAGVTIKDPESTFVDTDALVGTDTVIYPGVVIEAGTTIGSACTIYPHVRVARSTIGDGVTVLDGTIVEDSTVEADASLGPYARLRPGSHIGRGAKLGNFVETKATRLGAGSKANHLSYLGNAEIGERVNVGAGTITCNYDGEAKHTTIIEDGAFIGSNTALVAPVRIGAGAYVGAGSTITEDVPSGALGLGRGRQVNKEGWAQDRGRRVKEEGCAGDRRRTKEAVARDETGSSRSAGGGPPSVVPRPSGEPRRGTEDQESPEGSEVAGSREDKR